jgi:hypothetical protein
MGRYWDSIAAASMFVFCGTLHAALAEALAQ